VNLVGLSGHLGTIRDNDPADYEAVFAVNVKGTFLYMSAELRNMRVAKGDARGGSIVNAASIAGLVGKPHCSVYGASKHAVVGITKAVAREEVNSYVVSFSRLFGVTFRVLDPFLREASVGPFLVGPLTDPRLFFFHLALSLDFSKDRC
jgi:hypothetical protein